MTGSIYYADMPRRNRNDLTQIRSLLEIRGKLGDFELVPIDGMSVEQAAIS